MLINKEKLEEINWVKRDPRKFKQRLLYELKTVKDYFPQFVFKQSRKVLYAEGRLITKSDNIYLTRIYYPKDYPLNPPEPFIIDKDVVKTCLEGEDYAFNKYSKYRKGVKPDVIKISNSFMYDENAEKIWRRNHSIVTIINLVCVWLHAYEYKKDFGGKWII